MSESDEVLEPATQRRLQDLLEEDALRNRSKSDALDQAARVWAQLLVDNGWAQPGRRVPRQRQKPGL